MRHVLIAFAFAFTIAACSSAGPAGPQGPAGPAGAKGDKGECYRNAYNKDLGRGTVVLTVGKTF